MPHRPHITLVPNHNLLHHSFTPHLTHSTLFISHITHTHSDFSHSDLFSLSHSKLLLAHSLECLHLSSLGISSSPSALALTHTSHLTHFLKPLFSLTYTPRSQSLISLHLSSNSFTHSLTQLSSFSTQPLSLVSLHPSSHSLTRAKISSSLFSHSLIYLHLSSHSLTHSDLFILCTVIPSDIFILSFHTRSDRFISLPTYSLAQLSSHTAPHSLLYLRHSSHSTTDISSSLFSLKHLHLSSHHHSLRSFLGRSGSFPLSELMPTFHHSFSHSLKLLHRCSHCHRYLFTATHSLQSLPWSFSPHSHLPKSSSLCSLNANLIPQTSTDTLTLLPSSLLHTQL